MLRATSVLHSCRSIHLTLRPVPVPSLRPCLAPRLSTVLARTPPSAATISMMSVSVRRLSTSPDPNKTNHTQAASSTDPEPLGEPPAQGEAASALFELANRWERRTSAKEHHHHSHHAPTATTADPAQAADASTKRVMIYEGPFATPLRRLKMLSITSCMLSLIGSPVLAFFGQSDTVPTTRLLVAAVVMAFGVGTTAVLTYVTKPYICRMWLLPSSSPLTVEIETLTLFGRRTVHRCELLKLDAGILRPLATFRDTETGRPFFVHEDIITSNESLRPVLKHVVHFPTDKERRELKKIHETEAQEREALQEVAAQEQQGKGAQK